MIVKHTSFKVLHAQLRHFQFDLSAADAGLLFEQFDFPDSLFVPLDGSPRQGNIDSARKKKMVKWE